MSTLSSITAPQKFTSPSAESNASWINKYFISVKGAPEVVRTMFKEVPPFYDQTYKGLAAKGSRVLALGFKYLDTAELKAQQIKDMTRESVENGLSFGGFLVFHCPLKKDTVVALRELHESMHRVIDFARFCDDGHSVSNVFSTVPTL
jgi:cation-transporting ATPase 13A1